VQQAGGQKKVRAMLLQRAIQVPPFDDLLSGLTLPACLMLQTHHGEGSVQLPALAPARAEAA
jgi:hypothetical protein